MFWNLAHSPDVPNEIIDQAMNAHVKILDYSCSQDRDSQKTIWLDRCVEEIRRNVWVIQALKQIRDICCLYAETPTNYNHSTSTHTARAQHVLYRQEVVNRLQQQHALVILITENLCAYMERVRNAVKDNQGGFDPTTYLPDDRYSHVLQVSVPFPTQRNIHKQIVFLLSFLGSRAAELFALLVEGWAAMVMCSPSSSDLELFG